MAQNNPLVSVVMSVYNGEAFLGEALESILQQTYTNFECIVIDDCSTDTTPELLQQYASADRRITVYRNENNLRLPSSLNKAIGLARGKYIARMDADDICLSDRLAKQVAFMESSPDIDVSFCKFMTLKNGVASPGMCGRRCDAPAIRAMLLFFNPVLHPGVIAKAELMKKMPYDPTHTCTEDLELWSRMTLQGINITAQDEYLMLYRLHDKQITATTLQKQFEEVAKVQARYYSTLLFPMEDANMDFLLKSVYFHTEVRPKAFYDFYRRHKRVNRVKRFFTNDAIDYAAFEIFTAYKHQGISKAEFLQGLPCFSPLFLTQEFINRKKRQTTDIQKCRTAAKYTGRLQEIKDPQNAAFPSFRLL